MELSERKLRILQAIIGDFISTAEPVGSRALSKKYNQALEKTIQQAAKILSNITNLTAFAITPDTQEDVLKTVNLLPVDDERVVIMIVSESGKVSNTTLSVDVGYSDEMLDILSKSLTYNYRGKTVDQALKMDIISSFESDV